MTFQPEQGDAVQYERSGNRDLADIPNEGKRILVAGLPSRAVNLVTYDENGGLILDLEMVNEQPGLGAAEIEAAGFAAA